MKGILFNVVQEVVEEQLGDEAWDAILERSGVDGAFTSLGTYDDADLGRILAAASEITGLSSTDILSLVGRHGFKTLAGRHPELLGDAAGWHDVLAMLDGIIHPEVEKIYPGADVPSFELGAAEDGRVRLEYRSHRGLCHLAEGLILGLGDWFSTEVAVGHLSCVHRGDEGCVLEVAES